MRSPGIVEGAVFALLAALAGSGAMAVFAGTGAAPLALRGVVAALGLAYVLYLLSLGGRGAGKVSAVLVWAVASATTLALDPPLLFHLLVQLAVAWLLRVVRVHKSALPALADLALGVAGAVTAVLVTQRTGSLFLVIWSVMLLQAAFVLIPRRRAAASRAPAAAPAGDRFARAHLSAESALRRLSATR